MAAAREFRVAAEQGYAPAQFNLGVMYAQGQGVARDQAQTVAWYRKAGASSDPEVKSRAQAALKALGQ